MVTHFCTSELIPIAPTPNPTQRSKRNCFHQGPLFNLYIRHYKAQWAKPNHQLFPIVFCFFPAFVFAYHSCFY